MSIPELRIYQEAEIVLRYQPAPHNYGNYVHLSLTNRTNKERIVYSCTSTHHILVRQIEPFLFQVLATKDCKIGMLDSLIEDIKSRLVGLVVKRGKKFTRADLEDLYDYIERLINYYTNDSSRLIKYEELGNDTSIDYELYEIGGKETVLNSPKKKSRNYRPSATRKETTSSTPSNNEGSKKFCNIVLVVFFLLIIIGFIFSVYLCGGYSFQNCS